MGFEFMLAEISNPITYPSMQCIIKHLEANKRFQLVAQCPSLVKIEKSQPLIIKELSFKRRTISVNGVEYKLGAKNKFEAPHTLAIKQLKGRGPQINVYWLDFPDDGRILELPQSFKKFKVRNFMDWSSDNPLIDRFIDLKSMPLKVIVLSDRYSLNLLDVIDRHEILRTSEGLMPHIVPRELFHGIGTLSTELIVANIEGVEVFDFLNLIDALLQPDRGNGADRSFITEDADLIANLFKAFTLLAEGKDRAISEYEEGEDECFRRYRAEYTKCDEFPNEIGFWFNDYMVIHADAKKTENKFNVWISLSKLKNVYLNC